MLTVATGAFPLNIINLRVADMICDHARAYGVYRTIRRYWPGHPSAKEVSELLERNRDFWTKPLEAA